jgi:hypothetical protein
VVVAKIDVLKFLVQNSKNRVAGIGVKYTSHWTTEGVMLVLCVGHASCLLSHPIIPLGLCS